MNLITPPSLNGKTEAPSQVSGASVITPRPTLFPERRLLPSLRTAAYYLSRHLFAGAPLARWLLIGMILVIPGWRMAGLIGGWWIAVPVILAWGIAVGWLRHWHRQDYIRFVPSIPPTVSPEALDPQDKIPIYVTGYFSVEGKSQRFTWLPGFFRTFATREHALMCQVAPRVSAGIGHWPEDELGLWYIFFQPEEIQELAWGNLHFGSRPEPAIAVTYHRIIPRQGRFRPERTVKEVIYIVGEGEDDGQRILADLEYDRMQIASLSTP